MDTDEQKTIFHISGISSLEMQVLNDTTVISETDGKKGFATVKSSLRNRIAVMLGLKGWDNAGRQFETEKRSIFGLPPKEIIKESLLNALPTDYINELGEKIQQLSLSTGADAKN
jgi:hypothetical protein